MRTVRALIGMPVICRSKKIGRMIQADISEDMKRMNGIWIDAGLRGMRYISSESLQMLGKAAIIADDSGMRRRISASPVFHRAISTDGRRIGAVTGAEINDLSFAVESLELSCGVWEDLLGSRRKVFRYTFNRETGEIIIDLNEQKKEESSDEERHDQGPDYRHAHRRISSDHSRRNELEDGEKLEHEGPQNRQMDCGQG